MNLRDTRFPQPFLIPADSVPGLTPRQSEVAILILDGQPIKVIATRLGVSLHTARRHVEHIYIKLGVHSRTSAALRILELARRREYEAADCDTAA